MSSLSRKLRRLLAGLFAPAPAPLDPESMSLHDWADLPAHHPRHDRAPC